ncbi:nuclear transport factor 2 family protein [Wenxinia saemankumensis]|uniref:SnoaL-like domain-containing protein n=1 Tax=Wenxinia saemankumensis TaxID=1447782 RepID=A0A1M6E0Z4_9RHOB|nr:nuclear transport factor 2 family protein [Wenxinia saemankumensis]SHI79040.1 SnoaL-like domain-containing protein [Wenxinia saemankumensis]
MADTIETFFAAWGETDPDARLEAIAGTLATGFVYCDPRTGGRITTEDELLDYIAAYTEQAPGWWAKVERVDTHHGYHRVLVGFGEGDETRMRGTYFAELDELGRIELLAGFRGDGAAE